MPAPSPLKIATQSVQRLIKEEAMYRKELAQQTERVRTMQDKLASGQGGDGDNADFMLRQETKAKEETEAVFGPLRLRINEATQRLEERIAEAEGQDGADGNELATAKEVRDSAPKAES